MSTATETDEQRKARYQATEHKESLAAIEAAEAILLPLGFTRRKADKVYFNMKEPGRVEAEWNLKEPEIDAHISRQSIGWNRADRGDGSFDYRLVVCARKVWSLRDARIAPGNRPALISHIEKVKAALAANMAYDKQLSDLERRAKVLVASKFPNLRLVRIEVENDEEVILRVKTKSAMFFTLVLNGALQFVSLRVSDDEQRAMPIENVARVLGAL